MTNPLKNPFFKYGVLFSLIPLISTYLLGHAFKFAFLDTIESEAGMVPDDPDAMVLPNVEYILPFAILSAIIAFTVWYFFISKRRTAWSGMMAGIVTVFVSYPILGFAIGYCYPSILPRISAAVNASIGLSIIGQMLTFWLTYPLGAVCGYIIAGRMIKKIATDASAPSVFD